MYTTENIQDIVRRDYRTADVFTKWGINYCCGVNHNLEQICELQKLDISKVTSDLDRATHTISISNTVNFKEWPIDFLVDYIQNIHHAYLKIAIPDLKTLLRDFVEGHRQKHPYLIHVEETFNDLADEISEHTVHEEESIFPYIKQISSTYKRKEVYGSLFVRTMGKPLNKIVESEHRRISVLLYQLRSETNNYHFNTEACTNHQVIYHKLKELDRDLVQHKYLENNILFPEAMKMEQELLSQ